MRPKGLSFGVKYDVYEESVKVRYDSQKSLAFCSQFIRECFCVWSRTAARACTHSRARSLTPHLQTDPFRVTSSKRCDKADGSQREQVAWHPAARRSKCVAHTGTGNAHLPISGEAVAWLAARSWRHSELVMPHPGNRQLRRRAGSFCRTLAGVALQWQSPSRSHTAS